MCEVCERCGREIPHGEEQYRVGNKTYCRNCVRMYVYCAGCGKKVSVDETELLLIGDNNEPKLYCETCVKSSSCKKLQKICKKFLTKLFGAW